MGRIGSNRCINWLTAVAPVALYAAAPVACAQALYNFDLPAQGLANSLRAIGQQSGVNIVFDPRALGGQRVPPLRGAMTAEQAIRQLIAGTHLTLHKTDGGSYVVVAPAPPTPPRQANRDDDSVAGPTQLDQVVVVGSRLNIPGGGAARVTVLDQAAIQRSGATQVSDVLRLLPQASTSFDESGNAGFLGAAAPQLRGLSPGSTLLLLNGRRLNTSGSQFASDFFDLNQLPLAAVDRIEVLTDTAAAIYGADAVGGAIDIRLKRDFEGLDIGGRYGTSGESDATERQATVAAGGARGRFSGMIVGTWANRDPVRGSDRSLTADSDFSRLGGLDTRSGMAYPGTVYSLDGSPLPGLSHSFAGIPGNPTGRALTPADFSATDGVVNLFERSAYTTLVPENERSSLYATGTAKLSAGLEAYTELLYSNVKQVIQSTPDALFGGAFGLFVVPASNPFNPFGVDVGIDHRFVDLGARTNEAKTRFSRNVVGVRGDLPKGFDFDLSYWRDKDDTEVLNRNLIDYGRVFEALASTDPATALNLFTTADNSQAVLDSIRLNRRDKMNATAESAEFVVRGSPFRLPAGPVQLAIGATAHKERIDIDVPDLLALSADRNSQAIFAETSLPLVSPAQRVSGIDRLEATLALRHDRFSGDVSTTNPQYGLLWRVLPSFAVRATYGEAFKTPSLYNLYSPSLTLDYVVADPQRGGASSDIQTRVGGNPDIQPETAKSTTLGFTWTPQGALAGLSFAASFFRIEQHNFVQPAFSPELIIANPDVFSDRIVRAAPTPEDIAAGQPGRLLSVDARGGNFGSVEVKGVDVDASYQWTQERLGDFGLQFMASYIDSYRLRLIPGARAEDVAGIANESGFPVNLKATTVFSWKNSAGWGAALTARYRDAYKDFDRTRTLPSQTLFDLQASYEAPESGWLPEGTRARIGVTNLTDRQGDFANGPFGYDPTQVDMRGRFYYVELGKKF